MKQLNLKEIHRLPKQRKVVSLFSGFGANTLGYQLSGFQVCVAVDERSEIRKVYEKNQRDIPFLQKSVRGLSGDDLLILSRLQKYDLDILDATPPLFWNGHTHRISLEDAKNAPLFEVARITKEMMPKIVVITTDKKISRGKDRIYLNEVLDWFREIGYKMDAEVLNSKFYHVPQEKEFLVLIGVRLDLQVKPVFPEAKEPIWTTKDVLEDLMHIPMDFKTNSSREEYISRYFRPGITEAEIEDIMETYQLKIQGTHYKRDRWEMPYYALTKSFTRPIHPLIDRVLSIWEAMRLQTYPDDFELSSNPSLNWQNICSSVPPNFLKHIANAIQSEIFERLL